MVFIYLPFMIMEDDCCHLKREGVTSMKMKKSLKVITFLIILAVLTGGGVYAFQTYSLAAQPTPTEQVKTATSTKGDILIGISADGVSRFSVTSLNFKSSGVISEVLVQQGQRVAKGDVLARLNVDNLQNQVAQAEANYQSALAKLEKLKNGPGSAEISAKQAAIDTAKRTVTIETDIYREKERLYNEGKASLSEFLAQKSKLESAKGQLKSAESQMTLLKQIDPSDVIVAEQLVNQTKAALDMAVVNLDGISLKAPTGGFILSVNGKPGESATAASSQGGAFIVMADSDLIYLDADVFEDDVGKVQIGQKVDIAFNAIPGENLAGTVASLSSLASTDSSGIVKYKVTIVMDKSDERIRSGMTASLSLIFQKAAGVVTIPNEAVKRVDRTSVVEVRNTDGTTEIRKISTGLTDGVRVEVTEGLKAGETLVIRKAVS